MLDNKLVNLQLLSICVTLYTVTNFINPFIPYIVVGFYYGLLSKKHRTFLMVFIVGWELITSIIVGIKIPLTMNSAISFLESIGNISFPKLDFPAFQMPEWCGPIASLISLAMLIVLLIYLIPYILYSSYVGALMFIYYEVFGRLIYGVTFNELRRTVTSQSTTATELTKMITPTLPGLFVFIGVISSFLIPLILHQIIKYCGFYRKIPKVIIPR